MLGLNEMLQYGLKGLSAYFFHAEKMRHSFPNAYTDVFFINLKQIN